MTICQKFVNLLQTLGRQELSVLHLLSHELWVNIHVLKVIFHRLIPAVPLTKKKKEKKQGQPLWEVLLSLSRGYFGGRFSFQEFLHDGT